MTVGEIMTLEVEYVGPRDTVQRAAELMRDLDVGMVPVVDGGAVAGIVTDRDIALRCAAEGRDLAATSVGDIMSREVVYVYEDQEVSEASRVMEDRRIRRLVVLGSGNRLVGVVSLGDLARAVPARAGAADAGAEAVNALIKDELAAVESYRQAVGRLHGPAIAELRRLENEHERAAALLQQAVAERGIEPALTAGAWGVWSRLVESAAAMMGETAAIKALKEGEEHGVRDYERALKDGTLSSDVRALIQTELLPSTRGHIPALERYLSGRGPSGTAYNADQGYGPAGGGRGVA
jgi:CBS domain-containing protein